MKKLTLAAITLSMVACQHNVKPPANASSVTQVKLSAEAHKDNPQQAQPPSIPLIVTIDVQCVDIVFDTSETDKVTVIKKINKNEVTYEEHTSDNEVEITSKGKTNMILDPGKIDVHVPKNCIIICKSMSGDLIVNKINCRSINADAMSGDIKIKNLAAHTAKITTMSGDLSYHGKIDSGNYELSTMSGDVNVFLDRNSSVHLKLASENTDISVDGEAIDKNSLSRTLNGGHGHLSVHGMSGDMNYYTVGE